MIVTAHIIPSMNISTICSRKSARGVPGPRSPFSCCNITCRRVAGRRLVATPWDVNLPIAARKEETVEGRASRPSKPGGDARLSTSTDYQYEYFNEN